MYHREMMKNLEEKEAVAHHQFPIEQAVVDEAYQWERWTLRLKM
jgi:hypothetical protein